MNRRIFFTYQKTASIAGFFLFLVLMTPFSIHAEDYHIEENFDTLESWEPLKFKKIKQFTEYSIIKINSDQSALKIVSINAFVCLTIEDIHLMERL